VQNFVFAHACDYFELLRAGCEKSFGIKPRVQQVANCTPYHQSIDPSTIFAGVAAVVLYIFPFERDMLVVLSISQKDYELFLSLKNDAIPHFPLTTKR